MPITIADLETLYGSPHARAVRKELDHVNEDYRRFIEHSPFVVLATGGPDGLDCSPRGDAPGVVRILDARTLALPDRAGNNRIDSLRNVVLSPAVALLFLVPGVNEMLRVNGRGRVSVDPALLARFALDGVPPRSVLVIDVEAVFFQGSRAITRSRLWDPSQHVERTRLPGVEDMHRRINGEAPAAEGARPDVIPDATPDAALTPNPSTPPPTP